MARPDLYQAITDRILGMLDKGTVPWRHPISGAGSGGGMPRNLQSGKTYRGVNVFLLAVNAWALGYDSPYWLTFRQARSRGGHVRKGEKSTPIIFWKQHTVDDRETGKQKPVPVLRCYHVFNAQQCEDLAIPGQDTSEQEAEPAAEFVPIDEAERIVAGYAGPHSGGGGRGPVIERGGMAAFYRPDIDTVRMPPSSRFVDREAYYATLFHELTHSTGHSSRLDRGLDAKFAVFGDPVYSKEELVAEMGAAFLAAAAGISPPTIEQSAAYIDGWRRKLKGDKMLVIQAAGAGQRAVDHILGQTFEVSIESPQPNLNESQSAKTPSPQPTAAVG